MTVEDRPIECSQCSDTGFRVCQCGGYDKLCGRRRVHAAHEFARVCECRPMNRNYQDKVASQRRVA